MWTNRVLWRQSGRGGAFCIEFGLMLQTIRKNIGIGVLSEITVVCLKQDTALQRLPAVGGSFYGEG